MDLLAQHEAFLRAIFDAPDDDTPRLVYADFLQENGDDERAEFIRYECELARVGRDSEQSRELQERLAGLKGRHSEEWPWPAGEGPTSRGFRCDPVIRLVPSTLWFPDGLRPRVVACGPHWYGATKLVVGGEPGHVLIPSLVDKLFALPFVHRATDWHLGGRVEELTSPSTGGGGGFALIDMTVRAVITTAGVETLARHRGARRVTALDLRHNNLDNDAARALVKSPYLDNLKHLQLLEGNRLRGKVWQQVIERFGEDVVG